MKKLWYKKKSSLHGSGLFAVSNIKKGDVLGKLEVYYDNELIKSKEIVSNTDAKKVNFMKRFLNSISFFVWG